MAQSRDYISNIILFVVALMIFSLSAVYLPKYIDNRIEKYIQGKGYILAKSPARDNAERLAETYIKTHKDQVYSGIMVSKSKDNIRNVVLFTDYRCIFCKKMEKSISYDAKSGINIVYKELPVLGPESERLAIFGYAANKSGKYLQYRKYMTDINSPSIKDADRFMVSNHVPKPNKSEIAEYIINIERNKKLAKHLHIEGTPAVIADGKIYYGWNDSNMASIFR